MHEKELLQTLNKINVNKMGYLLLVTINDFTEVTFYFFFLFFFNSQETGNVLLTSCTHAMFLYGVIKCHRVGVWPFSPIWLHLTEKSSLV